MSWDTFRAGLLNLLGAPDSANNQAVLLAWANEESAPDIMRWNNPFNTTLPEPGSHSENSVGVQSYPDEGNGITATYRTLTNGYYPSIISCLRNNALPSTWRTDAAVDAELGKWGTGSGFLAHVMDPAQQPIIEDDMKPDVLINPDGSLEPFWIEGGNLNHAYFDATNGWTSATLGSGFTGQPTVKVWADGHPEVFMFHADGTLWHTWRSTDLSWNDCVKL